MKWSTSLVSTNCPCWCPSLQLLISTIGTHTYVSRNVLLLRHGHFFMNYLYTLLLIVKLISRCEFECLFKVNQWVVYISFRPNYARKVRTQRERGKRLNWGCGGGEMLVCGVCVRVCGLFENKRISMRRGLMHTRA